MMSRLKKLFMLLYVISIFAMLTGCSKDVSEERKGNGKALEEEPAEDGGEEYIPELSQVQGICELAAWECYYHNVAKSVKEPGTGVIHFGEKERPFWMEYTGVAEISFQSDLIKLEQQGKEITITLPFPEVTCRVEPDSWNEDSYIISRDQWIQKNPISAEDQTQAINAAQADMKEMVENNSAIIGNAKDQAKILIKNYIDQIGLATGVEYHVSWKDANPEGADDQPSQAEEASEDGGKEIR